MVFTASLLGAQHIRDSVENKPASFLVVSLGKALNGMPQSLCGRQMVGPSSLPVVVAQSDERHANRAWAHTREWKGVHVGSWWVSGCACWELMDFRVCMKEIKLVKKVEEKQLEFYDEKKLRVANTWFQEGEEENSIRYEWKWNCDWFCVGWWTQQKVSRGRERNF